MSGMRTPRYGASFLLFFFNDTATTEIYTLSLHDALPIFRLNDGRPLHYVAGPEEGPLVNADRKSTRLNSSHGSISYAVFCLNKNSYSISLLLLYFAFRVSSLAMLTSYST